MKKSIAKILLLAFVLSTFAQANPLTTFAQEPARPLTQAVLTTKPDDTEVRIKRVEQGLLPCVLIKGDPPWSIEERMKFYKVPG